MPLRFVNKDITKVPADIIVNPSDGTNFNENNVSKVIAEAGFASVEVLSQWGATYTIKATKHT